MLDCRRDAPRGDDNRDGHGQNASERIMTPGPPPKAKKQRRNRPTELRVLPSKRWAEYWGSDIAQLADVATDRSAIERLFTLYDERERAYRAYRRERFVTGSQGQIVAHPAVRLVNRFDKEIRQLEIQFGLTPRARLQLGITFGKTMGDLNRALAEEDDGDGDEADPRLQGAEQFFTGPTAIAH